MPAKPFNLERLFEPRKPPVPLYPSIEAELDAIKAGKKQMSIFWPTVEDLVDPNSFYFEILELAFERGLVVVLNAEPSALPKIHPQVFVAAPDQLWRVPALLAVNEARGHVSGFDDRSRLALEMQQSVLLGYTASQRKAYVARERQREDGIYVLLTREQKERVVAHGRRCFGPPKDVEGMTFFFHRAGRVKPRAATLVPKPLTLARAMVRGDGWRALFPDDKRRLIASVVTRAHVQTLNDSLYGRIDFMTSRGWH